MINALALCAALLAPESTGLDPHGRALHLKLHTDFNTSYEACITTVKQSRKYGIDPFVSTALLYKTTKFSPKLAKKSRLFRKIRRIYGCEGNSGQFIKSSCSAFMVFAPYFAELLQKNRLNWQNAPNYRKSLRFFLKNNRKQAKIVENMSKRFADVYMRSRTGLTWNSPFNVEDEDVDYTRKRRRRQREPVREPYGCVPDVLTAHSIDECYMKDGLSLISDILGRDISIRANNYAPNQVEFIIDMPYGELRNRLRYASEQVSVLYGGRHRIQNFREYNDGKFVLHLSRTTVTFVPKDHFYYIFIK